MTAEPDVIAPARTLRRRMLLGLLAGFLLLVAATVGPLSWVGSTTADERFDALADVPQRRVALVLGAGVRRNGTLSPFLRDRADAAVALYQRGSVAKLLMTGDNSRTDYDEVGAMKAYAVVAGVPAADVTTDHAGFSTYDSCYRAKAVFGVRSAVVLTQGYHLARAVYTCRRLGIDAVGLSLPDWEVPQYRHVMPRYQAREALSTIKAVWQLHVTRPEPHFLGPYEPIG